MRVYFFVPSEYATIEAQCCPGVTKRYTVVTKWGNKTGRLTKHNKTAVPRAKKSQKVIFGENRFSIKASIHKSWTDLARFEIQLNLHFGRSGDQKWPWPEMVGRHTAGGGAAESSSLGP